MDQAQELVLRLDQLREVEQDLKVLLGGPGWKRVSEMVRQQEILRRQQRDALKLTSFDSCFQMATLMGEADGMKLVGALAQNWLDQIEEEIQATLNALESEGISEGE